MRRFVDLDRYPLDRLESPEGAALIARCREELARTGMFNLPGFLRPGAAERLAAGLAPKIASESFTHARRHNIYFKREIPGLEPGHPALREVETVNHTLCGDQLVGTGLDALHAAPDFAAFLAAVMEKPALFPMEDSLGGVNVMGYRAGEALNWHFDRSEFTTTLLLQAPDEGGLFEYRTDLRTDTDPNYEGVARLLRGEDAEVRQLALAAGTLNVFKGKNTAHRVTPVAGPRERMIAVFSFYDRPGVAFSDEERIGFYGRAA